MNARSWLQTLALISSLGCDEPFKTPCTTRTDILVPAPTVVAFNRQRLEVEVRLSPPFACPDGNPKATRVESKVFDPNNVPLEHTATPPTSNESSGYTTMVSFMPNEAGSYFVDVRFEPSIGAQHRDVTIVEDRRSEQPFLSNVSTPVGCKPTVVTNTLVLCQIGSTAFIIRPAEAETFRIENVGRMAYAAPALWVWGANQVMRYTLGDSGAPVVGQSLADADSGMLVTTAAAATSTSLTLFFGSAAQRYSLSGDVLTSQRYEIADIDVSRYGLVAMVSADHFGVMTVTDENAKVCEVSLGATPVATCAKAEPGSLAVEGSGVWVTMVDRVGYYTFATGRPSLTSISNALTGDPQGVQDGAPYFQVDSAYLFIRPATFRLDGFMREAGSKPSIGVLRDAVWLRDPQTNLMRAYRR